MTEQLVMIVEKLPWQWATTSGVGSVENEPVETHQMYDVQTVLICGVTYYVKIDTLSYGFQRRFILVEPDFVRNIDHA